MCDEQFKTTRVKLNLIVKFNSRNLVLYCKQLFAIITTEILLKEILGNIRIID